MFSLLDEHSPTRDPRIRHRLELDPNCVEVEDYEVAVQNLDHQETFNVHEVFMGGFCAMEVLDAPKCDWMSLTTYTIY
jgi:hypothetical protein